MARTRALAPKITDIKIFLIANRTSYWLFMYNVNKEQGDLRCLWGSRSSQTPWPVQVSEFTKSINKGRIGHNFHVVCANYRSPDVFDEVTSSSFLWAKEITPADEEIIA